MAPRAERPKKTANTNKADEQKPADKTGSVKKPLGRKVIDKKNVDNKGTIEQMIWGIVVLFYTSFFIVLIFYFCW